MPPHRGAVIRRSPSRSTPATANWPMCGVGGDDIPGAAKTMRHEKLVDADQRSSRRQRPGSRAARCEPGRNRSWRQELKRETVTAVGPRHAQPVRPHVARAAAAPLSRRGDAAVPDRKADRLKAGYRSVSFSSMRRLRRSASSLSPVSIGWNSPNPAATRCCGLDAFADQILHDGDGARCGQVPVRLELRRLDRPLVGVAVDPHAPKRYRAGFRAPDRATALASVSSSPRPVRVEHGIAGVEQDFGLEHEAVADDPHAGPVAEDVAQTSEEIRTVARKLLHLLRERDVQPVAEIGDARLGILVARSRRPTSASSIAASWRRRAAICWFRISTCANARCETCFCARPVRSRPSLARAPAPAAAPLADEVAVRRRSLSCRAASSVAPSEAMLASAFAPLALLERKQRSQFLDLPVELGEDRVLAGHVARQEELRDREDGDEEDEGRAASSTARRRNPASNRCRRAARRPRASAISAAPSPARGGRSAC